MVLGQPAAAMTISALLCMLSEIFCAGVADGYGGVAEGAFLDEYIGKGFTDDIASADDDDVCAFDFDAAFKQKLNDTVRRAGQKRFLACYHFADVYRVKTVDIFGRVDCQQHFQFIDMFRQRQLVSMP